jgi:hypothetical protein
MQIKYILKTYANSWSKLNLLKATLLSYNKAVNQPLELIVFDDKSDSEKLIVIKNLLNTYTLYHNLIENKRRIGHGWGSVYACETIFKSSPDTDLIMLLNDDTIFHSNWYNIQLHLLKELYKRGNFGCFGLYSNTKEHPFIDNNNCEIINNISICQKDSTSGFGLVVTRDLIDYMSKINKDSYASWDWAISDYIKTSNRVIYKTKNSYLQHIGKLYKDLTYTENFLWEH